MTSSIAADDLVVALGAQRADAIVLDTNTSAHGAWVAAGNRR